MNKAHKELMRERYENAVHEYCHAFCQKHGYHYDPDMWVGGRVGEIIEIADYFCDFVDIRYDIDNDIAEEMFVQWYDYSLELAMLDAGEGKIKNVNYEHYCMGARPYSVEDIEALKEAKARVDEAKRALEECIASQAAKEGGICIGCKHSVPQLDGEFCRCSKKGTFHKWHDAACEIFKEAEK